VGPRGGRILPQPGKVFSTSRVRKNRSQLPRGGGGGGFPVKPRGKKPRSANTKGKNIHNRPDPDQGRGFKGNGEGGKGGGSPKKAQGLGSEYEIRLSACSRKRRGWRYVRAGEGERGMKGDGWRRVEV